MKAIKLCNSNGTIYVLTETIMQVRKNWTKMPQIASKYPGLEAICLQQVKRCIDVGLTCVSSNPKERPSVQVIIDRLSGGSSYPSNS
jgi:hypothetical protein